ncbi:MAG: peroxiredoxin [Helicobacteraceae bacterium]|jgi:peroxiredoxin (alkyl hydroperoxide reductase subunit C)|nr:peroxiredoxin [Helicobacteraceae bacterium]
MSLVTTQAPNFTAKAVLPSGEIADFELYKNIGPKGAVLFFWPMDFTFVCPSEIIAFDKRVKEFRERGFNVIGVSIDSEHVHWAWKNTPVNSGGIGQVQFPIVADVNHAIVRAYDVEHPGAVAFRATFVIDAKDKAIRHATINDLPIGRNVDETLRVVDAVLFTNEHGEVCPAGWHKGEEGMKADHKGVADYLSKNVSKL